jgi:hypothetical protein
MNGSRGMLSLARSGCVFQAPNVSIKTKVRPNRRHERSAAQPRHPMDELKAIQRDSSTSLGMTANLSAWNL